MLTTDSLLTTKSKIDSVQIEDQAKRKVFEGRSLYKKEFAILNLNILRENNDT